MKTRACPARPRGFSLIEVLIAVIVLSFGLLALAALQGSLFKASAEAKAQSVALGLASEKLEFFRGYRNIGSYQSLDTGADSASFTVGGINYTRSWTVSRYAYPTAGGSFTAVANTGATAGTYVANNEFKRVVVDVKWFDAEGVEQRVSLEAAIAALDPGDSAKVGKMINGSEPRGPRRQMYTPTSLEEGVVPIAIGGNTDTAATNPKPLVNNGNVIETRFNVLTYSGASGNTALAQSNVDTTVVGCTCDYGNKPTSSTARGKRPTYWNGFRYATPENTEYVPPAGEASGVTQSQLCTICCRDHHDPASVTADMPKFDPRNIASHRLGHFLLDQSNGALAGPVTSGQYTESCRIIRVDGMFRVAADSYNDYTNLLNTNSLVTAPDAGKSVYVPTGAAVASYQNFVKGYLNQRIVSANDTKASLNNILAENVTATSALEGTHGINSVNDSISVQASIDFKNNEPEKWLHLRGLYIDYLEDAAVQAIKDAKACTLTDKETCVLKVLPFTSINLTELANWTPRTTASAPIAVDNANFANTLTSKSPVRGKVQVINRANGDQPATAQATIRRSNSGLTTLVAGIDTEDASSSVPSTWSATQPFTVKGTGSGSSNAGVYTVSMDGTYAFATANRLYITSFPSATCNPKLASPPNPYTCSTSALGTQTLTIGNYNYQIDGKTTATVPVSCTGPLGPRTFTPKNQNEAYDTKTCRNYRVTEVRLNGSTLSGTWLPNSGSDGTLTEATTIAVPVSQATGDQVSVVFDGPVETQQTPVCTYVEGNGSNLNFTVSVPDCP